MYKVKKYGYTYFTSFLVSILVRHESHNKKVILS